MNKQPGRLITAMATPFDAAGQVDYVQARKLAAALIHSGSHGLVISGTTGETPTLTREEKLRLWSEVKAAVGGQATIIAGTGNYSTAESLALTKEAEKVGVDACLLVVPYYNKPTPEGLYEHFKTIAAGTHLPCILYNVPSRTVTDMSAETVIRLSHIDNVIGLKEASGKLDPIVRIIDAARPGFLVYSGNDNDTLPILSVGGYGVISVASHLVGAQIREMIESYLKGKVQEAAAIHRRLLPLVNALFIETNPIPLKYALNSVGFAVGKPRLPLTELSKNAAAIMDAALKSVHIDLPVEAKVK